MDNYVTIKVLGSQTSETADDYVYNGKWRFVRDSSCTDYDWLVVIDELPRHDTGTFSGGTEVLRCPRAHTILEMQEPVSVKRYGQAYTRQFGHILTNRPFEAERHPGYTLGRGYMIWYYPGPVDRVKNAPPTPKTKILSTVCSNKQMRYTRHHDRLTLTAALAKDIPELDWFGKGVRPIAAKKDALDPYKYHLAVENHIAPHHWTEKLSDPILARCLTFYAGDPAIAECLPAAAVIPIPIDDPDQAAEIIRTAIDNGEYEKRLPAIEAARRLILEKYNPWAQTVAVIEEQLSREQQTPLSASGDYGLIRSRRRLRRNPLIALVDGFHHMIRLH